MRGCYTEACASEMINLHAVRFEMGEQNVINFEPTGELHIAVSQTVSNIVILEKLAWLCSGL